jgi:non-lysosomal glucosylceramidase
MSKGENVLSAADYLRMRSESGLPMGGIGSGKIEFFPDGRFTNITINNNWDCPIVNGNACMPQPLRIKQGFDGSLLENRIRRQALVSMEGLPGAWLAYHTPLDDAKVLKTSGRPCFQTFDPNNIIFKGSFPIAQIHYEQISGLQLTLDAFSSFDLCDNSNNYRDSSLPLALFVFEVTNIYGKTLPITLAFSWQNLNGIGGYAGTPINQPDPTPPTFRTDPNFPGLWFGHVDLTSTDPRVLGDYSLRCWTSSNKSEISYCTGWNPSSSGQDVWEALERTGNLSNRKLQNSAGALGVRISLEPNERSTIVFALAWNVPHLLAAESRWDNLVRVGDPPPPPSEIDRTDYGHMYKNWFLDSWSAAEYGLTEWESIRTKVLNWQRSLANTSLPNDFVLSLCNDLSTLVSNTWYTRQGVYAVNESPTEMRGCLGTMDQRGAGNAVVACMFPNLNKAELNLFASDQIRETNDSRRFGTHWNTITGSFDLQLDRMGAILHDYGWDHLQGGRTGDDRWASAHWPELTSLFVLQSYQYALWTGDKDWLENIFPNIREALRFQARLDQNNDGVPDLWGPGSCTYDTEMYPYYGASSYVTGLYLAALRAAELISLDCDDAAFADRVRAQFSRAKNIFEDKLWDESLGYYINWLDSNNAAWDGHKSHHEKSTSCQISQLAGAWWADLLDLGDIFDSERRKIALKRIAELNVDSVPGIPADEFFEDQTHSQSMINYVQVYFAAQAIAAGLPDLAWLAIEKIFNVRYKLDGSPWDSGLLWAGKGNTEMLWGRWYMSNPASWYVLWALSGVRLDRLHNKLTVTPNWPSKWACSSVSLPVYLPGLTAEVECSHGSDRWYLAITIRRLVGDPISVRTLRTKLPKGFINSSIQTSIPDIDPSSIHIDVDGYVNFETDIKLEQENDGFSITASMNK